MSFSEEEWVKRVRKATTGEELIALAKEIPLENEESGALTSKEGSEPSTLERAQQIDQPCETPSNAAGSARTGHRCARLLNSGARSTPASGDA